LYWREQKAESDNWNRKFRDHVQRQWLSYQSALEHDTVPRRIPSNWQPSEDVYDVLRLANIDVTYAQELLPEFVIYWRDSNQVYHSWNTRFLQYVKKRWASAEKLETAQRSTREISLVDELTDRSWAQ
ncbi:MAG TPA: DnaT-like ssDNA-binding domain-containing protein, partial [Cellvibrionaceae bacterium]|nr:DnaT-like ssDNA-binding domain-containing protein [Cellvibrionaceae bacterium]